MALRIDYGCGNRKPEGFIGVDIVEDSSADIIHDLAQFPYPFQDSTAEYQRFNHVLEHFDKETMTSILREAARIGRPGSTVEITVPHYLSVHAAAGDHVQNFSRVSMDVFCQGHDFPAPEPVLFEKESFKYRFNDRKITRLAAAVLPRQVVAETIPNTVQEITWRLKIL